MVTFLERETIIVSGLPKELANYQSLKDVFPTCVTIYTGPLKKDEQLGYVNLTFILMDQTRIFSHSKCVHLS